MIHVIFSRLFNPLKKCLFILLIGSLLSACELEEDVSESGYTLFIQASNLSGAVTLSLNDKQTLTLTGNEEPHFTKSFSQNLKANESIDIYFRSQPDSQMCLFS